MTHSVVHRKPMFYWLLKKFFPSAEWNAGVIITYGNKIYCKYELPPSLIAHELTHVKQQRVPLYWWIRYVLSASFRFNQELEAHQNEYKAIGGRPKQKQFYLEGIADRLSGPLYNNLVSKEEAKRLILQ